MKVYSNKLIYYPINQIRKEVMKITQHDIRTRRKQYYLSTREIIIISSISALGGTLSSFVSQLGRQIFSISGVKGIGQIVAGIHVFWLTLLALLIPVPGVATFAGVIKGLVELFTGSPHGILAVIVSVVQGLCIDGIFLGIKKLDLNKDSLISISIASCVSSASNVFVTKIIVYKDLPLALLLFLFVTAGVSGVIFGGFLAYDTRQIIYEASLLDVPSTLQDENSYQRSGWLWRSTKHTITGIFLIFLILVGSAYTIGLLQ